MDIVAELTGLVGALDAAGIEYAVCGAIALAIHGVPRDTADIDLLIKPADTERFREVVRGCGFTIEQQPFTFSSTGVTMLGFTKLEPAPLVVDALVADDSLAAVWNDRTRLPYSEGSVNVVSRGGLVALKLMAARPQDLADVERLSELDRELPTG